MRGLRAYVGFRQTGVDYVRPERMFGHTTNSFTKNIDWAKKGIFSFSNVPLTMLTTAGLLLLTLSILAAFIIGVLRIAFPDIAPRGVTTMLIAILMFGSLNLFGIGLVGEYIGKIMLEVRATTHTRCADPQREGFRADGKTMRKPALPEPRAITPIRNVHARRSVNLPPTDDSNATGKPSREALPSLWQ